MPSARQHKINWILVVLFVGATLFLSGHILLNNGYVQQLGLHFANRFLGVHARWERLRFNGLTGKFYGRNLGLKIPKARTEITLDDFEMVVDPLGFFTQRIRLARLKARGLSIIMEDYPERSAAKSSKVSFARLINLFDIRQAEIADIRFLGPGNTRALVATVSIKNRNPLFILAKDLDLRLQQVEFRSPKFDLFSEETRFLGTLEADEDKADFNIAGRAITLDTLMGFNKRPNPSNTQAAFDESLNVTIAPHYPQGIPENRTFWHLEDINLPLTLQKNFFKLKGAELGLSRGKLALDGEWNKSSGDIKVNLQTVRPPELKLLPLGKSNFRRSFEHISVDLKAEGKFFNPGKGSVGGTLKAALTGNIHAPEKGDITLAVHPAFKDGRLQLPDLLIKLGEGSLESRGEIDLVKKTVSLPVTGRDLDTQTIVRLFSTIDVPGTAGTRGRIDGPLKSPNFDLDITSPGFGYTALRFGTFSGGLKIQDGNFDLKGRSAAEGGSGNLELTISDVFHSGNQGVKLNAQINQMPAGFLLNTAPLSGRVSGKFTLTKKGDQYSGEGKVDAADLELYKISLRKLTATLIQKNKTLKAGPVHLEWGGNRPFSENGAGLDFAFDDLGYTFKGKLTANLEASGTFKKAEPDHLKITATANRQNLMMLTPLLPLVADRMETSGNFDIDYAVHKPLDSKVKAVLTAFDVTGEEKAVHLNGRSEVEYAGQKIRFNNTSLRLGNGAVILNGLLGLPQGSDLNIKGKIDLGQIVELQPWLTDAEGIVNADVTYRGDPENPTFSGRAVFANTDASLRGIPGDWEGISGSMEFSGQRVTFNNLKTIYSDAPLNLDGWIEWAKPGLVTAAGLKIRGQEIPLAKPDIWRLLSDVDVSLTGSGNRLTLAGKLSLVEGLYYKDYSVSEFVLKPIGLIRPEQVYEFPDWIKALNLNLDLKSAGTFEIRNNLAEMDLTANLHIDGTFDSPQLTGNVNAADGTIHAFGIDFEDATGFADFSHTINPFIDFQATQEVQTYVLYAKITGPLDNLALSLESAPALSRNEIISLLAYGRTPDQLTAERQNQFSTAAVASQILSIFQRPLSRATQLDIVKLESTPDFSNTDPVSRFSIGKQISDRVAFAFTTDISLDETFRGFMLEYQILDHVLLKGTKEAGTRYRFDLTWRFEDY